MAGGGQSSDGDFGFQIAPMVDVVFVLLLFFMAAAGSQVTEQELNISLPSGRSAAAGGPPPTPIIIEIRGDGTVFANNRQFDNPTSKELQELRAWLTDTFERFGTDDPVIIQPTMDARHERIMDVLNAASASGVKKLSFG